MCGIRIMGAMRPHTAELWRLEYSCGHRLEFIPPTSLSEWAERAHWLAERWQRCERCATIGSHMGRRVTV
jgi:hypothetical protein